MAGGRGLPTGAKPNVAAGSNGTPLPAGSSAPASETPPATGAGTPPAGTPPAQVITTDVAALSSAIQTIGPPPQAPENLNDAGGRRVRLRPKPAAVDQIYGSGGPMLPLYSTKGMVFPYQPTITYSQDVTYQSMDLTHTNQEILSYVRTPAVKFQVDGDFTVQNQTEGLYALACIHFLRTVSKMDFGSGPNPGTPPPVLLFDGYGQYMFNALPVVLTQFAVTLPKDVDYVPILVSQKTEFQTASSIMSNSMAAGDVAAAFSNINKTSLDKDSNYAWLPSVFTITVQLTVQNTPQRLRRFNINDFRSGALLKQGSWV